LGAPLIRDTVITDEDEVNNGFNGDEYDYGFRYHPFGGSTFGLIAWD
jgi:hypothetical protein